MQNLNFRVSSDEVKTNARIRYLPDENGVYVPYEMVIFDRAMFMPSGWEKSDPFNVVSEADCKDNSDTESGSESSEENRRKSYNRARNNLFDILMCTTSLDSFVTLTLDETKVNRYDYGSVVKRLGVWLDNRVRRNGLTYVFVPEFHKDGAIHFHGLVNKDSLKLDRARNPKNNRLLYDNEKRPIFNISDFSMGYNTLIPLSGENARIATAKYCYKYITKTHGEKVGGRYYLSGGELGRPRFEYVDADYSSYDVPEIVIGGGCARLKKIRF